MTADEDSLNVHAGHVYEFIGQDLVRQSLPTSCQCRSPEKHDARVRAMLGMSFAIEVEAVILLPHPIRIPNWYFAL
jgi:hypothetical protein